MTLGELWFWIEGVTEFNDELAELHKQAAQ